VNPRPFSSLLALSALLLAPLAWAAPAPPPRAARVSLLRAAALLPAPSGAEHPRLQRIAAAIGAAAPAAPAPLYDSLGNLVYRFGAGRPAMLVVTEVDEPGYVVSAITPDGYLRLQEERDRLPLPADPTLLFAHALTIETARGDVTGVGAGLSVHLQPSRQPGTAPAYHLDNLYVDLGARAAAEVAAAGVDVLDPVTLEHGIFSAPGDPVWVGTALSSVASVPAVAEMVARLSRLASPPSIVVAFATEGYFDHDGLQRLETEYAPAATLLLAPGPGPGWAAAATQPALAAGWQAAAAPMAAAAALPPPLARMLGASALVVEMPVLHLHSDAEILSRKDVALLARYLPDYLAAALHQPGLAAGGAPPPSLPAPPRVRAAALTGGVIADLRRLVETTGVSGHEAPVRELIQRMIARELPPGAAVRTDPAGNLIVAWGPAHAAKSVLFIAHMDEVGWQVEGFLPDGQLALKAQGFGYDAFYGNHVVLVHAAGGAAVPGALTFVAGAGARGTPRLDLGMSEAEARALGVAPGDPVAIPKKYRPLLNGRASARSFDDRVGCASLVAALGALRGYQPTDRRVIFVWSTGEELGLVGATELAQTLHPTAVFAIDTFVSSDSPLETHRFADAPLGRGFVLRALDNGLIVPRAWVARVRAIAARQDIPVQYGATGGSTDGVPFLRWGSQVVALGWPLRYSHSPGEVIDTRDVQALAAIIPALAREW